MDPKQLPVYTHRDVIVEALTGNQVIVVESPTGSGKTTQIPKILHDAGFSRNGKIGVTQPRRIAAVSVSSFIAKQYGVTIPGLVGYKMRFIDQTNPDTKICIMTDGILLQELKASPYLSAYTILMVDEAHERSLNIDFTLGLLKDILRVRDDLKVVISSATINARVFSEYFDECPVISIEAPVYPVSLFYKPTRHGDFPSLLDKIGETMKKIIAEKTPGDVLIFLSGEGQIKECTAFLSLLDKKKKLKILPLYSRLSQQEQENVFYDYSPKRKVIIATNIAETSITIDGIRYVIDPGYAKLNYYNPKNFTSSLIEVRISKASCNQRKGRAGRTAPGICYRLFSEEDYDKRMLFTKEEIYRRDLSEVILRMAELGIKDFEQFDFISNPGRENIRSAIGVLHLLGAIDEKRDLTSIGEMMVKFPINPRLSRMIVASIMEFSEILEEVLIAAAFLNDRAPFLLPHGFELEARKAHHSFRHKLGDFVSYLKIYRTYEKVEDREDFCKRYYLDYKGMVEIYNVKNQLAEIVSEMGIPIDHGGSFSDYLKAVSKGLIQFVCKRSRRGGYNSLTAYGIKIHPGSVMYKQMPEYIVAGEIMRTSQMYAMSVSTLEPEWLKDISGKLYTAFVIQKGKKRKRITHERDFTSYVKIGSERFEIRWSKKEKKKIALFPFKKLKRALSSNVAAYQDFRGLKGKVTLDNYEMLVSTELNRILEIVRKMQSTQKILHQWPKGIHFEYLRDAFEIVRNIPRLLSPCIKKKGKKRLGFLTLLTDGNGHYWYTSYTDFLHALEESVSSLESLIDEDIRILTSEQERIVNSAYRKLTELLEE